MARSAVAPVLSALALVLSALAPLPSPVALHLTPLGFPVLMPSHRRLKTRQNHRLVNQYLSLHLPVYLNQMHPGGVPTLGSRVRLVVLMMKTTTTTMTVKTRAHHRSNLVGRHP